MKKFHNDCKEKKNTKVISFKMQCNLQSKVTKQKCDKKFTLINLGFNQRLQFKSISECLKT